ncbi:hypothetical protein GOBAR_AA13026 [Gossypium barbadense]|uniref:Uncharacterized protein n=1 Tax=Gossypium barbadense TaxID=3634 RepID=A0A2P5XWA1_GOSBA|nr:hypothetical protein GOBAR_AA13026 [Gossypium barbadense]
MSSLDIAISLIPLGRRMLCRMRLGVNLSLCGVVDGALAKVLTGAVSSQSCGELICASLSVNDFTMSQNFEGP